MSSDLQFIQKAIDHCFRINHVENEALGSADHLVTSVSPGGGQTADANFKKDQQPQTLRHPSLKAWPIFNHLVT